MAKYAPGLGNLNGTNTMSAWASGELFEAAVTASGSKDITSASVRAGLLKLRGETLGGLTQPLTFSADKPTLLNCWFETRVVNGSDTAASAVKMAYASWTKGSSALLLSARALAQAEGVEDALLAEWELSQPQLPGRLAHAAQAAVTKGWRWVGEMEEIAASMAGAGLPDGFHQAAAEIYRRPPRGLTDRPGQPVTDAVLDALLAEPKDS